MIKTGKSFGVGIKNNFLMGVKARIFILILSQATSSFL